MTAPLSDQEIEADLARLRANMAPGPTGTPIHISSGYGEFTLRVIEQLRRQRDEARKALEPFAREANTDTIQTAIEAELVLTVSNGFRMFCFEAYAFEDARTALAKAPSDAR